MKNLRQIMAIVYLTSAIRLGSVWAEGGGNGSIRGKSEAGDIRRLATQSGGPGPLLKVGYDIEKYITNEDDSELAPEIGQNGNSAKWTIRAPGGSPYIAIHFRRFDLEEGCVVTVGSKKNRNEYQMTGRGKLEMSEFWSQHVKEDECVVDCHCVPGPAKSKCHFEIDKIAVGFQQEEQRPSTSIFGGGGRARQLFPMVSRRDAICGTDDKENAVCYESSHTTEYGKARAVARLLIEGSTSCTGWLASPSNHLVTNEHCISSEYEAANTDYEFMAEAPECSDDNCEMCHVGTIFSGATFIQDNYNYDYCLVQITSGNPASTYGFLEIDNRDAVAGEEIYIPQHPGGRAKELGVNSTVDTDGICRVDSITAVRS